MAKNIARRLQELEQTTAQTRGIITLSTDGGKEHYRSPDGLSPATGLWPMFLSSEQAEAEGWQCYGEDEVDELQRQGWSVIVVKRSVYDPA